MTTQHTSQAKISKVIDYLEKASGALVAWIKHESKPRQISFSYQQGWNLPN